MYFCILRQRLIIKIADMISYIDFEHYRLFSGKQHLRLAPLTVVFGRNNTGKSAVLRLPMLISSAMNCVTNNVFEKKWKNCVTLCDEYRDVVYGKGNQAVGLFFSDPSGEAEVNINFIAENGGGVSQSRIEKLFVKNGKQIIEASVDDNGILVRKDGEILATNGLSPVSEPDKSIAKSAFEKIDMAIDYIGPVRWKPKRFIELDGHPDGSSGIDGKNAYTYLINDSLNARHPLLDSVAEWYRTNFGGWRVEVGNSRSPVFTIELKSESLPGNNILDTGFGIQQSLPIVVAAYRKYNEPTLVIIEEPETHLNSSAHAELGQLLAMSAIKDRDKRFLVETHSLNLMIRLRTLIAKGVLSKEDVALYFVDYDEKKSSSQLREVIIKENGEVKNWPEHMFGETLSEALALRNAQMEGKV